MNTPDQNRRMFKYLSKWYDVSEEEYLKNWHQKIKEKTLILDVVLAKDMDGVKPDVVN